MAEFETDVALDALGLLSDEEQATLHHALKDSGSTAAAALYDIAASELAFGSTPVDPPAGLRDRLMARIAATPRVASPEALSFIMNGDGWQPHPLVSGIQLKQLALDQQRGIATLLMKVAPGTVYPAHHHHGPEECYVIDGDVFAGGRHLSTGDFHHADAGSDHQPLSTIGGCTVLLVVDARDYLHD